jgi:hypothetical protein
MAAGGGGERRMVFDIRGRRKHVVKFVYAILALLMGASLFLVVGPVNINALFGGNSGTANSAAPSEEQAERIERKLRKSPENPDLLLGLTRARISAGNNLAEINPETGAAEFTPESRLQLEKASEAWAHYLKATDEPSASGAQLIAGAQFSLAQTSRTAQEAEANVRAAAKAQELVAEARPSLGSLSTLALYRAYSFDYAGARQAGKEAEPFANTKFERENLGNELETYVKRGHSVQAALAKLAKEAKKAEAKGQPAVANPLSENNPLAAP